MMIKENDIVTIADLKYMIRARTNYMGTNYYLSVRLDACDKQIPDSEEIIYVESVNRFDYEYLDYVTEKEKICFVSKDGNLERLLRMLFQEQMRIET